MGGRQTFFTTSTVLPCATCFRFGLEKHTDSPRPLNQLADPTHRLSVVVAFAQWEILHLPASFLPPWHGLGLLCAAARAAAVPPGLPEEGLGAVAVSAAIPEEAWTAHGGPTPLAGAAEPHLGGACYREDQHPYVGCRLVGGFFNPPYI